MKCKIILMLIAMILIVNIVNAEDILVKYNELTPFKIGCTINGTACSGSATCNATIRYPSNMSYLSNNVPMENLGNGDFRINVTFDTLGTFTSKFECTDGGETNTASPNILSTPTGRVFDQGQSNVSVGILIAVLAIAFLFLVIGFSLEKNESTLPIGFLFVILAIILGLYALHLSYTYTYDIIQYESMTPVISVVYTVILWSITAIGILSMVMMLIAFVRELGKIGDKKKFGDGFNPITGTYE